MSRTRQDILDTESMLQRLASVLEANAAPMWWGYAQARTDAESLRRISMTLHRWHELECGDSNDYASWTITRGRKDRDGFHHDENGRPYLERHTYQNGHGSYTHYNALPDREAGARKRLASILKQYPGLTAYVQGDPRDCALYILRPGDVPAGGDVGAYYSRGLAVHQ